MEANKQADQVLDRAITLARHLRHGETHEALQAIIALRGTCDWLGRELWQRSIAEVAQAEECSSLLQTSECNKLLRSDRVCKSLGQTNVQGLNDIPPIEKARHDLAAILARKAVRA